MKASDLSETALSLLNQLQDQHLHTITELSERLVMKKPTARAALNRMVIFGLVDEKSDVLSTNQRKMYKITDDGLGVLHKEKNKPIKPGELQKEIMNQVNKQKSIVPWLRTMAESFNMMADNLSSYDE